MKEISGVIGGNSYLYNRIPQDMGKQSRTN